MPGFMSVGVEHGFDGIANWICVLLCDFNQVSSPLWAPDSSSVTWVHDLIAQGHLVAECELVRGTRRWLVNETCCPITALLHFL